MLRMCERIKYFNRVESKELEDLNVGTVELTALFLAPVTMRAGQSV